MFLWRGISIVLLCVVVLGSTMAGAISGWWEDLSRWFSAFSFGNFWGLKFDVIFILRGFFSLFLHGFWLLSWWFCYLWWHILFICFFCCRILVIWVLLLRRWVSWWHPWWLHESCWNYSGFWFFCCGLIGTGFLCSCCYLFTSFFGSGCRK